MTAKNDHTGDLLQSRMNTKEFEENFDRIFRNKTKEHLTYSIEENVELYKQLSQVDYEYELNKATGDVEKRFTNGIAKPNNNQFDNIKND